jgi:hypothetical protein
MKRALLLVCTALLFVCHDCAAASDKSDAMTENESMPHLGVDEIVEEGLTEIQESAGGGVKVKISIKFSDGDHGAKRVQAMKKEQGTIKRLQKVLTKPIKLDGIKTTMISKPKLSKETFNLRKAAVAYSVKLRRNAPKAPRHQDFSGKKVTAPSQISLALTSVTAHNAISLKAFADLAYDKVLEDTKSFAALGKLLIMLKKAKISSKLSAEGAYVEAMKTLKFDSSSNGGLEVYMLKHIMGAMNSGDGLFSVRAGKVSVDARKLGLNSERMGGALESIKVSLRRFMADAQAIEKRHVNPNPIKNAKNQSKKIANQLSTHELSWLKMWKGDLQTQATLVSTKLETTTVEIKMTELLRKQTRINCLEACDSRVSRGSSLKEAVEACETAAQETGATDKWAREVSHECAAEVGDKQVKVKKVTAEFQLGCTLAKFKKDKDAFVIAIAKQLGQDSAMVDVKVESAP